MKNHWLKNHQSKNRSILLFDANGQIFCTAPFECDFTYENNTGRTVELAHVEVVDGNGVPLWSYGLIPTAILGPKDEFVISFPTGL